MKKKIVFFTGSGVSVNSGLPTYRMEDGLWNDHDINKVATSHAVKNNLSVVNVFFNTMRQKVNLAKPNEAHYSISKLQDDYDVTVITQNIDDLHERSGTEMVYHLHGNIFETRTTGNTKVVDKRTTNISEDERCPKTNGKLRPNVVLFDEIPLHLEISHKILNEADYIFVIGTSLSVWPVNQLILQHRDKEKIIIIDKNEQMLDVLPILYQCKAFISKDAIEGMKVLTRFL